MKKRLQNKISESRLTLPAVVVYACLCWLLCGLLQKSMWVQAGCMAVSTFLMLQLNSINALLRIYSRMVSCMFLVLSCMACYLFPSVEGGMTQMFFIATYLTLFNSYQDQNAPGITFYGSLCFGLASLASVHVLFLLPVLWMLMMTNLQSLSWRTFLASVIGVALPYLVAFCWGVFQQDLQFIYDHFLPLADLHTPFNLSVLTGSQKISIAVLIVLGTISTIHFWQNSYLDKYRIRMLYGLFIRMDVVVLFLIFLQPQYYDPLMRLAIVNTAPLIAHFFTLSNSRVSNITFIVSCVAILTFTAYNIWMSSPIF